MLHRVALKRAAKQASSRAVGWLAPPVPSYIGAALRQAQFDSVRRQVPMLLTVAAINTAILMAVCAHAGMELHRYGWMALLILYCAVRLLVWARQGRGTATPMRVEALLRMNVAASLTMMLILGFLASFTFAIGTFNHMLLVPMSLGFGSASIAHCLYTLRPAAIGTILLGMGPSSLTMILVGPFEAQMLGCAMLSVGLLMIRFVAQQYDQLITNLELTEENRRLAHVDALTGIANRRAMMAELDAATHGNAGFGVALIDLDGFKLVNDTHGHAAGDALLRSVAERLSATLEPGDKVGRLGGDEFILVFHNASEPVELSRRSNNALMSLSQLISVDGYPATCGASLGFAGFKRDAGGIETMLHAADEALYAAKRRTPGKAGLSTRAVRRARA